MPKFQCPEGVHSVSVGGEQYNADDKGQIDVPDGAAVLLEPHGFKRVPGKAAAEKPAESSPPQDEQTGTNGEQTPPATTKATTKKAAAEKPAE